MAGNSPFFSIIIPTYNRPARIVSCLEAIAGLAYPVDRFEVIIIDDGGDELLDDVIAPFLQRLTLRLLRQDHAGVAVGRNTGAAIARGEFLVFTDDDCRPAPDWLSRLADRFAKAGDCIIGGRTVNALPDNVYSTASQTLIGYLFSYFNANPQAARFLTGSNLAIPAAGFFALGGFDKTFILMGAEEREFCDRWQHNGGRMMYAPEVLVYHFHTLTFRSFLRQHYKYGCGAYHYQRLKQLRCHHGMKVEPFSFYLKMLRFPFALQQGRNAPLLAVLLVSSQAANSTGFFMEKLRSKSIC
ncbi:MAG: putative glycosyltransferase [Deltaproteobacteria bacterium]|nr:putative glycosyltransferase [Deltaproteobacteria bacterium]